MDAIEKKANALRNKAEPFATATVVRCESPTSAKPGARGLVTREGRITGWIGGGCAQPIVIEEALNSLKDGAPRLVRITPHADSESVPGMKTYEMVCHSGGTMDIFIEPVLPAPQLVLLGRSPVARTLVKLASAMGYEVRVHSPLASDEDFPPEVNRTAELSLAGAPRPHQSFVVVCTQGEDDEGGVREALRFGAPYVALVASPKKWKAISAFLTGEGVTKEELARVRVPAGVEINAREPEEIAVSILAEIVSVRRSEAYPAPAGAEPTAESGAGTSTASQAKPSEETTDPICHMTVNPATASYTAEYQGATFYFCCAGCQQKFQAEPERYVQ